MLAKLLLNCDTLGQAKCVCHPGIEASIKVNDWARVGAARVPGHQGMALHKEQYTFKADITNHWCPDIKTISVVMIAYHMVAKLQQYTHASILERRL